MPKKSERERLADLETRQRKVTEEVEAARLALRGRYASVVPEMAVETLTEREFREILNVSISCGGTASIAALKTLAVKLPSGRSLS